MSFVRTVLGDIPPDQLGLCYAHEHVIIDAGHMTDLCPDFLIDSVDLAVEELVRFRADGGSAMVDCIPSGGRNSQKLAEVSRRTGVHIVCPTGLHLSTNYPPGHWGYGGGLSVRAMADLFAGEIELGILTDGDDPHCTERLPQRAGVIKIAAAEPNRVSDREAEIFRAAVLAQQETGCPIITHTEQGTAALKQVQLLESFGADLRHVVLSHTDKIPDLDHHRRILETGVCVEYDGGFRWARTAPSPWDVRGCANPTRDLVVALAEEFPGQIMLGMDAARRSYWRSYGGAPGLSWLLKHFREELMRAGLSEAAWERIMINNPAVVFSFQY